MKKKIIQQGIVSIALIFGLVLAGCGGDDGDEGEKASVTSVTISPKNADVQQGGTKTFTETVVVTGGAAQTVTWSISGETKATSINAGKLTVAADEPAGTEIIVTATSTVDASKKDTATVTVKAATVTPPADPLKGSWIDDDDAAVGDEVDIAIFTGSRVYFSTRTEVEKRQGNLDTAVSTIKLKSSPDKYDTYNYSGGTGDTLTLTLQGQPDKVLKRMEGSTKTTLNDVWISSQLVGTGTTYFLIVTADKMYYNYTYNKYWKTDTYTFADDKYTWDNWSTTSTEYFKNTAGTTLKIKFPVLTGYDGSELEFVKTTKF